MPLLTELLSSYALIRVTLKLFHLALAGLKAGDEILEINNRAAGTLNSSVLKDFLSQPSLGLLVRTHPEPEEGVELLENPPHRVDGPVDLGESPLAFLTSNPGMLCPGLCVLQEPVPREVRHSRDTSGLAPADIRTLRACSCRHEGPSGLVPAGVRTPQGLLLQLLEGISE